MNEAYRPARHVSAEPFSIPIERQELNAHSFIESYINRIRQPLVLMNHTRSVTYGSDNADLNGRRVALEEYLLKPPPHPETWIWGRTIVAEVVAQELMQATLSHALRGTGMYFDLVPTSIDKSSSKGALMYQKGTDICLFDPTRHTGDWALYPVCGFDVTVGKNAIVNEKRKKPGIQLETAFPVGVVQLRGFTWGPKEDEDFNTYVDQHARRAIREKGCCLPFYALDDTDVSRWQERLLSRMSEGLSICKSGYSDPLYPEVAEYKYMKDVEGKLDFVNNMIAEVQSSGGDVSSVKTTVR